MATNRGTLVSSPIMPYNTNDTYASHLAKYGQGGWRSAKNLEEMYSITKQRREVGMACVVSGKIYILTNNPDTDLTSKEDWAEHKSEVSSITIEHNGETISLEEYLQYLQNSSIIKYMQFINYVTSSKTMANLELICPFDATLDEITSTVPVETDLTSDLIVELQKYDNGHWNTLAQVSIGQSSKTGTVRPTDVSISAGSRLKMIINDTTVDDGIELVCTNLKLVMK